MADEIIAEEQAREQARIHATRFDQALEMLGCLQRAAEKVVPRDGEGTERFWEVFFKANRMFDRPPEGRTAEEIAKERVEERRHEATLGGFDATAARHGAFDLMDAGYVEPADALLDACDIIEEQGPNVKIMRDLLSRAAAYIEESAPDATWWREYFLLTGDEMYLTAYGWEPRQAAESYLADARENYPDRWREEMDGLISDSVNVPSGDPLYPPAPAEA